MAGRPSSETSGRFPNRVRVLRTAAKLTQEELAEKMNVTFSAIGKLERGATRLRIDQAQTLSKVLHCHPVELFLPLTLEEREAMQLLKSASPTMRRRMVHMMKMLMDPLPTDDARAA